MARLTQLLASLIAQLVKNLPAKWEPWVRKIPRRERLPIPVFWPGESHGLYNPWRYSPWGRTELDSTERLSLAHSYAAAAPGSSPRTQQPPFPPPQRGSHSEAAKAAFSPPRHWDVSKHKVGFLSPLPLQVCSGPKNGLSLKTKV